MWSTLFGAVWGLALMAFGVGVALSRKPQYITTEKTDIDGNTTTTQEYRPLRWGGRLLMLGMAVGGLYMFAASVAPDNGLVKRATATVTWLFPVVLTTGVAASFAGTAVWLLYRRVLGFERSPRSAGSAAAIVSVEGPEPPDFVAEALAGEAVEANSQRLFRALARHRVGALVLAVALLGASWYFFGKVPAAWRGDYDSAMAVFLTWEMAFGAAEAVVFLLLPLIMVILIVVALFTARDETGPMFGGLAFLGVVAVISYYTGFIDPLFELAARVR